MQVGEGVDEVAAAELGDDLVDPVLECHQQQAASQVDSLLYLPVKPEPEFQPAHRFGMICAIGT